ncbi:hypothetical protein SAMN02910298_01480 [Pseudobutyrivibrio sp. YE44]|uniref:hypothetical protein n=1 Tax=Pseudobutyrivibrio sp. YE44 TaxID=1520802 RepID=UPI000884946E|nr:hypothetical protein [Pseudobutyrivibrio sp. YE44]SDB30089.1 hypothetical protein SAMN02910298_01480 [Pseudobutyrivibrio sp. YE44]
MKRLKVSLLVFAMVGSMFTMVGCGDKAATTEEDVDKQIEEAFEELDNSEDPDALIEDKLAELDEAEVSEEKFEADENGLVTITDGTDGHWFGCFCPGTKEKIGVSKDELGIPHPFVYEVEVNSDSIVLHGALNFRTEEDKDSHGQVTIDAPHTFKVDKKTKIIVTDGEGNFDESDLDGLKEAIEKYPDKSYCFSIDIKNGVVTELSFD